MMFKIRIHFLGLIFLFVSCTSSSTKSVESKSDSLYIKEGDSLVLATFDTLRISLQRTIAKNGFEGAVSYCNVQALSLTNVYKSDVVSIERVSTQFRNHANAPDSLEREVLKRLAAVQKSELVRISENEVHYFKPIIIQPMCLACHGDPQKDIQPAVLQTISKLYPDDKAIGYKEGDLRGAWHIIFRNNSQPTAGL